MHPTTLLILLSATLSVTSAYAVNHRHNYRSVHGGSSNRLGNINLASPTSTSTPAPVPTGGSSSPNSTSSGGRKRGLAFNDPGLTAGFGGPGSQVTWGYNWGPSCASKIGPGLEFVAMLWGNKADRTNGWMDAANAAISGGGRCLLAFNEPDHPEQSNIDPASAATAYQTYMNPFTGKARLGAPAVTNGGGSMGLTWLKSFMDSCGGKCQIDFVPIHWYGSCSNAADFKKHTQDAYAQTNKPIWITEFGGVDCSLDQQKTFLETVLPWLDAQSFVERYAYFGVFENSMITNGKPNDLGKTFDTFTGN
ncbi:hypothetical protein GP486_007955 [Trichoglossum hirsutum]|uniref:Asl1-like glycosyl hydrolase catalytic domain-containing protein n=1 Tax=Trichoglossum hirsutum TaxID=265104 RepID=A0A9P8IAS4_9PEZI|nr:hypothetical protein GP486_007955 [Trichoglossum hirsutum]